MKRSLGKLMVAVLVSCRFGLCTTGQGAEITGLTYTYDLSMADPMSGLFTMPHVDADDTTSLTLLTDGELGDEVTLSDPDVGCCFYNNGTYAGFVNDGFGGASQPKVDVDLGGMYNVDSLTLYYLVEDSASIYAPQPIPDGAGGNLFDALTVSGSTNGVDFSPLGSTNDFKPVFGLDGDFGSGIRERRSAVVELGGAQATHVSIDVHTPYSYIFLSEFVVDGTAVGGLPGDYNGNDTIDAADYTAWRDAMTAGSISLLNDPTPGTVDESDFMYWRAHFGETSGGSGSAAGSFAAIQTVPEPAVLIQVVIGCAAMLIGRRLYGQA